MSSEVVGMGETISEGDAGSGFLLVTSGIGERLGRYKTTVSRLLFMFGDILTSKKLKHMCLKMDFICVY